MPNKKLTDMESTEALYIRFGEIPEDERSVIYQNGEIIIGKEKGVSVWKAIEVSGYYYYPLLPENVNENTIIDYFDYLIDGNKNVYLVTGNELETHGSDGEPLLRNVKIIKDITDRYKKGKLQNIQAENKRLTTLAELGNTRANDYRAMRDRALKAEAENESLQEIILTDRSEAIKKLKAEAYKEFADSANSKIDEAIHNYEKVKKKHKSGGQSIPFFDNDDIFFTEYNSKINTLKDIKEDIDNLLKELVGDSQ